MVAYRIVFLAGAVAALPLNINLGAYSPALVVGDGEISFGGNSDVSKLMSTLEGAAVNAANGAAANGAAQGQAGGAAQPAAAAPAAGQAQPSAVATTNTNTQSTTASVDPTLSEQAQQIAALQGMGKAVLPRDVAAEEEEEDERTDEETGAVVKRDLASFDRALKFAEVALSKGPTIQLGTGDKGAGVGILVQNGPASGKAEGAAAAAPAAARKVKRDGTPTQRVKVTTMYVRSGIPASLQNGGALTVRDLVEGAVERRSYETIQIAPSKREASANGIDAVNLNVNGEQGVTMTFVETVEDGDED